MRRDGFRRRRIIAVAAANDHGPITRPDVELAPATVAPAVRRFVADDVSAPQLVDNFLITGGERRDVLREIRCTAGNASPKSGPGACDRDRSPPAYLPASTVTPFA